MSASLAEADSIGLTGGSTSKLQNSQEVLLSADLDSPEQYIICHVMCDDIGTSGLILESIRAICKRF